MSSSMRLLRKTFHTQNYYYKYGPCRFPLFICKQKSFQNMHFSLSVTLISLLSLSTFTTGIQLPRSGADTPGGVHLLEPHIASVPRSSATLDPRSNLIRGLLFKRQSCSSGFDICRDGGCCPLGGACCGSGWSPIILVHFQ